MTTYYNRPKVSVCMLAYNNRDYIDQAVSSVLAQEVDFPVQLVICEDASTDDVRDKINAYKDAGCFTFVKHFNAVNLGLTRNLAVAIGLCDGEYVAYLDNDDYWTDRLKLRKQVDLLDSRSDASICYHPTMILRDGKLYFDKARIVPPVADILDLARGNFIQSCSILFRASDFNGFPDSYFSSPVNDYFLLMLLAQSGLIVRCEDVMSVYRIHSKSDWSSRKDQDKSILEYLDCMVGLFDEKVSDILQSRHQKIAYSRFVRLISEPGFSDRMQACLKYGDAYMQSELIRVIDRAAVMSADHWRRTIKWWRLRLEQKLFRRH